MDTTESLKSKIIAAARTKFIETTIVADQELDIAHFHANMPHVFDYFITAFNEEVNTWIWHVFDKKDDVLSNLKISPEFTFLHWLSRKLYPDEFGESVFTLTIDTEAIKELGYNVNACDFASDDPFVVYSEIPNCVESTTSFSKFIIALEGYMDTKAISKRYDTKFTLFPQVTNKIKNELIEEYDHLFISFFAAISAETNDLLCKDSTALQEQNINV